MKKVFLTTVLFFFFLSGQSKDILALTNQDIFEGKITKIEKCQVHFKSELGTYLIPAEDIFFIQFENPTDKVLTKYLKLKEAADENNCLKGATDANLYHGKNGGHIILGVLFGPFAVLGAAVASPTPMKGKETLAMSKNRDLFSDPEYLKCYKKKAKGQNVGNAAIGWAAWMILWLLISQ